MKYPQLVSMPSAVSDWLEEQLEARGIDAVVYTRYILSLLHSDAVDVIYSDEDLHFSRLKKEVKRPGGGRKRIRRSSEWRHAEADAEQLKRTAAIECLMSASEQTYGIESLIDELCEKLKEIKSDVNTPIETPSKHLELQPVSPQELAKQYYAAFPPLSRNSANSPTKLIPLIPKWIPSPIKKKNSRNKHINRSIINNYEEKLHNNIKIEQQQNIIKVKNIGKQKLSGYFNRNNNKNKVELSEGMMQESDFYMINNNSNNNNNNNNKKMAANWPQSKDLLQMNCTKLPDHCFDDENIVEEWNIDEETNLYDDLPVDIKDLLDDSPSSHDETVEMMNIANMRDTGKRDFIQCGTNITSSIWSNEAALINVANNYQNKFNTTAMIHVNNSSSSNEFVFDLQTNSDKSIDNNDDEDYDNDDVDKWSIDDNNESFIMIDNEKNSNNNCGNEKKTSSPFVHGFNDLPVGNWDYFSHKREKWSDTNCFEDQELISQLTVSLMKLNHNGDTSPFVKVMPKTNKSHSTFNPFNRMSDLANTVLQQQQQQQKDKSLKKIDFETDCCEDLLTSASTHFRAINEKIEKFHQGEYADGATFVISNNLDKVNYKRSSSGNLYLENDYGMCKKYFEYKLMNDNKVAAAATTITTTTTTTGGFTLKFNVSQNDKSCQTDFDINNIDNIEMNNCEKSQSWEEGSNEIIEETYNNIEKCTCPSDKDMAMNMDYSSDDFLNCPKHPIRSDSILDEVVWKNKQQQEKATTRCEKCNRNSVRMWNTDWLRNICYDSEWNNQTLRNIWNGGEVCYTCLNLNGGGGDGGGSGGRPPPSLQYTQLREDISQDGDQLLLDLNSMQKTLMEQEFSCDISSDVIVGKNQKRRHSFVTATTTSTTDNNNTDTNNRGSSFSFASRLEEDCLIQMSTIPTLRSVTL